MEIDDAVKAAAVIVLVLFPKLSIIVEMRETPVGTRRFQQWEQPFQHRIDRSRRMPDVKIEGIERVPQMPLRVVIEAAAVKLLVTVGDGPFNDIVKNTIVEIELECDRIVETDIFVIDRVAL